MNSFKCKVCGCIVHGNISEFQSRHIYNDSEDIVCDGQFELISQEEIILPEIRGETNMKTLRIILIPFLVVIFAFGWICYVIGNRSVRHKHVKSRGN